MMTLMLSILCGVLLTIAMIYAYQLTRDPLHPLMFLGPLCMYSYVYKPIVLGYLGVIDYYFDEATLASPELIANALNASDRVQREDVAICESVQRGLRSGSYDRGRYSVTREGPMHHFHRLLAADLAGGLGR
jgi:hypothetical protein